MKVFILIIFISLNYFCVSLQEDVAHKKAKIEINSGVHQGAVSALKVANGKIYSIGEDSNFIVRSLSGNILKTLYMNENITAKTSQFLNDNQGLFLFSSGAIYIFNPTSNEIIGECIGERVKNELTVSNRIYIYTYKVKLFENNNVKNNFENNIPTNICNFDHEVDERVITTDDVKIDIPDQKYFGTAFFHPFKIEHLSPDRLVDFKENYIIASTTANKADSKSIKISNSQMKGFAYIDLNGMIKNVGNPLLNQFDGESSHYSYVTLKDKTFYIQIWNLKKYLENKDLFKSNFKTFTSTHKWEDNNKYAGTTSTIEETVDVGNKIDDAGVQIYKSNPEEEFQVKCRTIIRNDQLYFVVKNKASDQFFFKIINLKSNKEEAIPLSSIPTAMAFFNNNIYFGNADGTISTLELNKKTNTFISGEGVEYEKVFYDFNKKELYYKDRKSAFINMISFGKLEKPNVLASENKFTFPDNARNGKIKFFYDNVRLKYQLIMESNSIDLESKIYLNPSEIENISINKLTHDKNSILIANNKFLFLINLKERTIEKSIPIESSILEILFSNDDIEFLTLDSVGTIKVWNLKYFFPKYGVFISKKGDFVIFNDKNYLAGSKEGLNYYGWRKKASRYSYEEVLDKYYSFDQFDLYYNRPDLILKTLFPDTDGRTKEITDKILRYKRLWELRIKQNGFLPEKMVKITDIRSAKVLMTRKPAELTTSKNNINIGFKIMDDKDEIGAPRDVIGYKIFVNGVPIYGDYIKRTTPDGKPINSDEVTIEDNITLSQGDNKIEVSGFTEDGVESPRESFSIKYEPPTPRKPDLYYIGIGVNAYDVNKTGGLDALTYAVKDSQELKDTFEKSGKGKFANVYTKVLNDSQVTRENIGKLKDFLKNSQVDDQVIVFLSGHGIRKDTKVSDLIKAFGDTVPPQYKLRDGGDVDDVYYYMTSTANVDKPWENAIPLDAIRELVNGIPSRQKILLVDTCQSGEKLDLDDATVASLTKNIEIRKTRGQTAKTRGLNMVVKPGSNEKKEDTEKKIIQTIAKSNALKEMSELFPELRRGTGTIEISAATGAQSALESKEWQNGAFTFVIKEAILKGKAKDEKGNITARSLRKYVLDEVEKLTDGQQTPMVARDIAGRDFVIFWK